MKALLAVFILALATTSFASHTSTEDCVSIYDGGGKTPTGTQAPASATSTVVDD